MPDRLMIEIHQEVDEIDRRHRYEDHEEIRMERSRWRECRTWRCVQKEVD